MINMFQHAEQIHYRQTRRSVANMFYQKRVELEFTKKSFGYIRVVIWEEVPLDIKNALLLDEFKNRLRHCSDALVVCVGKQRRHLYWYLHWRVSCIIVETM